MATERDTSKPSDGRQSEHIKDASVPEEIGGPGDPETGPKNEPPGYSGGRRRPLDEELDFDTYQNWGAE